MQNIIIIMETQKLPRRKFIENLKILIFTLIFITGPAFGQNLPIRTLDLSKGLSNNSVNAIFQDANRFMWFGSYDGLNRFDGYQCKVYRNSIGDSLSLRNNNINCIEGDRNNNIWVGGYNGVSVLDLTADTFRTIYYRNPINNKTLPVTDIVYQIKSVSRSLMLVGTQNNGLIAFEDGKMVGTKVPLYFNGHQLSTYDVSSIESDYHKKICWVFINKIGLCKYDLNTKKLTAFNNTIRQAHCMLSTSVGLWIGSDDGLYLINEQFVSRNYMQKKCMVTTLLKDSHNTLWIGTDGCGIFSINEHSEKALPFNDDENSNYIKSNSITSAYEDADRNIWFSTLRGGVFMLARSSMNFKHIVYDEGRNTDPSKNFIVSFAEDQQKNIWLGTDGAGLRYWNRATNKYTEYSARKGSSLQLSSNFVPCMAIDRDNSTWLALWGGGVNKIDTKKKSLKYYNCYNTLTKTDEENVWFIFIDSKNNIWASTARNGHLFKYNPKSDSFQLFYQKSLDLACMIETENGNLWAGNNTSLLLIDPISKKLKNYPIENPVRCIAQADANSLWIGTDEGGLFLYNIKASSFKRFTIKDGLPSNTILKIAKDKQGILWLSSYNGLCRFDPKKMIFRNFSVSDGLQSNQFSYNAGQTLSSGEIIFGGINGFNIFYPGKLQDSPDGNKLVVTGILVNNMPIEKNRSYISERSQNAIKTITIPYNKANLSLDFASIDFINSDKITYAYWLEGLDKGWNYPGKTRKANYTRLSEGTYFFKAKTTNVYGKWNNSLTLIKVIVLPPWYRSIVAYILYLLCVAVGFYLFIQYNNNKQRLHYEIKLAKLESKKEKELAEKQLTAFTYISHEFRTPISLIINPIKQSLQNDIDGLPVQKELTVAYRNARRLLSLVDQLLLFKQAENGIDNLKVSAFNLQTLCEEVFKYFEYTAKEKEIKFELVISVKNLTIYGDYEKLEIVFFNLLSNAFKFTPKNGCITLKIDNADTEVFITISDTGHGIEEEKVEQIFDKFYRTPSQSAQNIGFGVGLYIVKKFIEKHSGTVTCISKLGKGTEFIMALKKGNDHFSKLSMVTRKESSSKLLEELLVNDLYTPGIGDIVVQNDVEILTSKKSIVILEDDQEMKNYLVDLFSNIYMVYSAANGVEGLELIKRSLPDIIITDINMDEMDGLSLCQMVKQNNELAHIPVILLTATTKVDMQLEGISSGADDYITKPFENEILLAKVSTLLKNRHQLRRYFLDNVTLKENKQKVPAEYGIFLNRCIEIIEMNLDREDYTIKDFSHAMGMSHSSLYKKIKFISGQTTNAFIRSLKLRRAAVLILTENITIAEAGSKVGIGDPRHFRRQFIKLFGMTPSVYIKKYRNSFNKDLNIIQNELH